MYRPTDRTQHSFLDFNQPMGLHMNPDNRWVKMADSIPWDEFETNTPACPQRDGECREAPAHGPGRTHHPDEVPVL